MVEPCVCPGGALATFNSSQTSLVTEYGAGRFAVKTTEAINRLSKVNRTEDTHKLGPQ